jgi:hypothetical protein
MASKLYSLLEEAETVRKFGTEDSASIQKMRANNGGSLPAYAWPGGYPIYYVTKDNMVLCADCANTNDSRHGMDSPIVACDTQEEPSYLDCDGCNMVFYPEDESETESLED